MKRLKFLIFFTVILVINTYRDNIFEKNKLILNDKYEVYITFWFGNGNYESEVSFYCPEYSVIGKEENAVYTDIYKDTDDYCGKLEKISRIGNYWVGRNFDHKDEHKGENSEAVINSYLMRSDEMKKK